MVLKKDDPQPKTVQQVTQQGQIQHVDSNPSWLAPVDLKDVHLQEYTMEVPPLHPAGTSNGRWYPLGLSLALFLFTRLMFTLVA